LNDSKEKKRLGSFLLAKLTSFGLQMKRVHHKTDEKVTWMFRKKKLGLLAFCPWGKRLCIGVGSRNKILVSN
jgi:hypothetical protein